MLKKKYISQNPYIYSTNINYNILEMNKLIKHTFNNYNIFVSNIYSYEYPLCFIFKFDIFIHNPKAYKIIKYVIKLLKSIFILKYNKNVEFHINLSKNIFNDDLLLASYIKNNLSKIQPIFKLINVK